MSAPGGSPPQDPWSWQGSNAEPESAAGPQSGPPADSPSEPGQQDWHSADRPPAEQWAAPPAPPAPPEWQAPQTVQWGVGSEAQRYPEQTQQQPQYGQPGAGWGPPAYGAQQYPPGPQPYGQPGQWSTTPPVQPARPAGKKRRAPLIVGLVAVVVVALVAGGFLLFGKSKPKLTYNGKAIDNADGVLSTGQQRVEAQVSSRHGTKNGDTRCYFAIPTNPAAGAKKTDISQQMLCGPVLFIDGTAGQSYLAYTISQSSSKNGKVVLAISGQPLSANPAAPPSSVTLQRPDGTTPPSNSGGLKPPPPPAAPQDALVASAVDDTKLSAAPGTALMVGDTFGVRLDKIGTVDRYGNGDSARTAASGTQLVAFEWRVVNGATSKTPVSMQVQIQVGAGDARAVPGRTPATVVAVPSGQTATLIMIDGGVKQELTLPDGKPGPDNILINTRQHRSVLVNHSAGFRMNLRGSGGSGYYSARYTIGRAGIFPAVNGHQHSSPSSCMYAMDLSYKIVSSIHGPFTTSGKGPFSFSAKVLHVVVGGKSYSAHDDGQYTYYELPANVTTLTVVITGSYRNSSGVAEGPNSRITITVRFPAG